LPHSWHYGAEFLSSAFNAAVLTHNQQKPDPDDP